MTETDARIPLLIDTDPGVDDALALLMAFDDMQSEGGRPLPAAEFLRGHAILPGARFSNP